MSMQMPLRGIPKNEIFKLMENYRERDWPWKKGKSFSLVYYAGEEHTQFLKDAYCMYFSENGLSAGAFPSLARFETEVVSMISDLLSGDENVAGSMTTGGTESIILAMKAYRDWAVQEKPSIQKPEIIIPRSAHPAFLKSAQLLGLKACLVEGAKDFRADVSLIEKTISKNTIAIIASAPSFAQGVVDPIVELGELAQKHDIGLHIDACLGSFVLPFLRKQGQSIPDFDFRVPGVTSISADLHKYGFGSKGASVVLYRNKELRRHQIFATDQWTGGLFATPGIVGTRPGGSIAAAWAALMSLGTKGYMDIVHKTMSVTKTLQEGIEKIEGLKIVGKPVMSVFSIMGEGVNIFSVADWMSTYGWNLDRQQDPDSIHIIVTPAHEKSAPIFLENLATAVKYVKNQKSTTSSDTQPVLYGVGTSISSEGSLLDQVVNNLEQRWQYGEKKLSLLKKHPLKYG